ncbi:uncharacterized protein EMH_0096890 [Eimeria mitis]|uniref:Uncharacterized protein n=1 Tax=Eimeria mitis TaxID=44415 RepID=U6KIU1_9EIME|nr:uncharacterized protein EMH_0096890 [Eimeria mitis]CDJ35353.1 hypothetical protein EMH_0096890 [Eimeria mitis]
MGGSLSSACFVVYHQVTKESPQPPVAEAHAAAKEGTASTSTAPVEDSLASSSRASSASQLLPSGVTPSQESGSVEQTRLAKKPNPTLEVCREILKKPWLAKEDLDELVTQTERLCGQGYPLYAIETLGTIFIVFDTLYCATEVLGDPSLKDVWLPRLVRRTEGIRFTPKQSFLINDKSTRNAEVARTLSVALEYYRRGSRPPARMVVGLKEALFCEPASSKFNAEQWDPWRADAEDFRESIESSLAENK